MTAKHPEEGSRPDETTGPGIPSQPLGPSAEAAGATEVPRLRRSRTDRVIAGVAGGIGHYLGVDPVLIRLAFVALVFAGGIGVLAYIVAWLVIPEAREGEVVAAPARHDSAYTARIIVGGVLIALGAIFLLQRILPWFDSQIVWALVLVVLGLAVIFRGVRR